MKARRRLLEVRAAGGPAPEVMHWSHLHAIRLAGARNVYTIHDAIPLKLPWATLDKKEVWLAAARAVAARADHIVTVSEHARRDLIALLGLDPGRITNTYQAVAPPIEALDERMSRAALAAKFGLEHRGYHLSLASVDPRKNLARLLDAFAATGIERPLVLIGGKSANAAPELRLLTEAGGTESRDGRVRHLGYLPRGDVELLVRHARSLLFPSLYEGFGLPAVEAMLAGTAVVAADASALPEVLGDAAMLVPPTDTRALAEAILAVDGDDLLRARLEAGGPARAALYSPARHRARLAEVYARLGLPFAEDRA
jgi:glycosyltransferase involved in cell wall biosynthesis